MDDLEQKIKQKLLEGLIEHMQDKMGGDLEGRFPKKGVGVAVLDAGHAPMAAPSDDDSDEDRLMELLGDDDSDEDDKDKLKGI